MVIWVTPYIVMAVYHSYFIQILIIRWRKWLTKNYLNNWLARSTYYHMQVLSDGTDNPDQRISEDLQSFAERTLSLFIGLVSSITTLCAFIVMLWNLSSHLALPLFGHLVVIPGYLVWMALIYSVMGTVVISWVGRHLIPLRFQQEKVNADFRFSLVRLRENSESIALYRGEGKEKTLFLERFSDVFKNFIQLAKRNKKLNWWSYGYGQAAVVFPIIVAMPAYFAKVIQIGAIMQISSAFGQVQNALSFIVNAFGELAIWHAVTDRLRFFQKAMKDVNVLHDNNYKIIRKNESNLNVQNLNVGLPNGTELLHDLNFKLNHGQKLIVTGASGSGKSTLIRALANIWPFGEGSIGLSEKEIVLFLPQKPYLPIGNLRDVILYPYGDEKISDEEVKKALTLAGLPQLCDSLKEVKLWSHILSLGEQQRLAFARIFLQKPNWVFMDEATASLDETAEGILYETLIKELPETAIASVGHRSSLLAFHDRQLNIVGNGKWELNDL